jgi:hypothetical protein
MGGPTREPFDVGPTMPPQFFPTDPPPTDPFTPEMKMGTSGPSYGMEGPLGGRMTPPNRNMGGGGMSNRPFGNKLYY